MDPVAQPPKSSPWGFDYTNFRFSDDGTYAGAPVGFRFYPMEDDIVQHFLLNKVLGEPMPDNPIKVLDVYLRDPEELPLTITNGERRWMYFFVYMTEENRERTTPTGYWKLAVSDEPINPPEMKTRATALKNTYAYHTKDACLNGRYKTNWTMDEFRLENVEGLQDAKMLNWVLCKIEHPVPQYNEVHSKRSKTTRGKRIFNMAERTEQVETTTAVGAEKKTAGKEEVQQQLASSTQLLQIADSNI